jgi:NADH dehydrogenase (ubiquinone) 1 alpha subcomplex subunit 9
VNGVTATVFGCSGFLARYVAQSLGAMGTQLIFPHRCDPVDVQHLRLMGDLGQVVMLPDFNIRDDDQIRHAISRSNLVLNFIGADQETWNYGFDEVHIDIPARIAKISKELGVERVVHFSAMGASADAPSRRLRTKAAGEAALKQELGEMLTIFKPAPVTGTEDRLFNNYARWAKSLPVFPLVEGGETKYQPVWVRDIAQAVVNALETYDSMGQTYHLAGPDVFSVKQLVDFTYQTIRESPLVAPVPSSVAKLVAGPREWLGKRTPLRPNPAFTADAIDELAVDKILPNQSSENVLTFKDLSIEPHKVTEGIPIEYLRFYRSGGYDFGTTGENATSGGGGGQAPHLSR